MNHENDATPARARRLVGQPFEKRLLSIYHDRISFHTLELLLYPHAEYPNYWKYSCNGGPPGGRMGLVKALKARGIKIFRDEWTYVKICYGQLPNVKDQGARPADTQPKESP